MVDVLSRRALNRATLARQLLLERHPLTPVQAVEHLVGLQAQAPFPPYTGLWSRLTDLDPHAVGRLIEERALVRVSLMRGTIHVVTARDAAALRPLVQRVHEAILRSSYGRELDGVDRPSLVRAAEKLLAERPRTTGELGDALTARWPDAPAQALRNAAHAWVPLVQLPPRAVWGRSGPAVHVPLHTWLAPDARATPPATVEEVVRRYLRAFGPATPADAQTWCGLTGLREVFRAMRDLRSWRTEGGPEVYDVEDAPLPDPDTPAPVRLLAEFDNVTLSHADRRRVIADEHRRRIATRNGMVPGMVLVDGVVAGTWRVQREKAATSVVVTPFERLRRADVAAVEAEALALARFLGEEAPAHDVRVEAPA